MKTTKTDVEDFIGKAPTKNTEEQTDTQSPRRGVKPGIAKKLQPFNLPVTYQDLIQRLADNTFNAEPGKGNKSEFMRRLVEQEAKRQKVKID